ncbi:unnamed protein product [Urochloa decumbens]|uniref:Peroxidase n=1 Tax=Urochloa decumbens TaxID=240449 RepID=A0ABC9C4F9_9POAL
MAAAAGGLLLAAVAVVMLGSSVGAARAQLRQNYYASSCPSAESTVRSVISQRLQQSFAVGPGTLRLFFHDCFVRGCDASVMLMAPNGDDESHSGADATLSPDAVDAINKAKAAVEALPGCAGKVSCADILAMAARDVVSLLGGPNYAVELGRLDGKSFNRAIVKHVLPGPGFNLDQLNSLFAQNGLTQMDMIALSACRRAHDRRDALRQVRAADLHVQAAPAVEPANELGLPAVAPQGVPHQLQPHGDRDAGRVHAQGLRQRLLQQPPLQQGPARLRPGALHRPPLPPHRQPLRREQHRLPGGIRRRHGQARQDRPQDRQRRRGAPRLHSRQLASR